MSLMQRYNKTWVPQLPKMLENLPFLPFFVHYDMNIILSCQMRLHNHWLSIGKVGTEDAL